MSLASEVAPVQRRDSENKVFYENKYIRWEHNRETGRLEGAVVKFGRNENLLLNAPYSSFEIKEDNKDVTYKTTGKPIDVAFSDNGASATFNFEDNEGRILAGVSCTHAVKYGPLGEAEYAISLNISKPVEHINNWNPLIFSLTPDMDWLGVRERLMRNVGYWASNKCTWKPFYGGKSFSDMPLHWAGALPVSLLFMKAGFDAIQFEMTDDLMSWDPMPDYQECVIAYNSKTKLLNTRYTSILLGNDATLSESRTMRLRISMPLVKETMVPLRRASNALMFSRPQEQMIPTDQDFATLQKAGYDLLRWHNDSDRYGAGIFWRDAVYPPYPKEIMDKMDDALARAHRYGIKVVPYFSVKEIHPTADGYNDNAENWAMKGKPDRAMRTSKFGSIMCLHSGWSKMRKDTIRQVLTNHKFDGLYYDWCTGIECDNRAHGKAPHWDNDKLLEHIKWSIDTFGKKQPELYIHTTCCDSIPVINAATMVITEEVQFPELGPEMFSPQVQFVNVCPRQICDMLKNADDEMRLKLAMCALLHHATVSSIGKVYVDFYANHSWLDKVCEYNHHSAPGQGIVKSDTNDVGMSVYWKHNGEYMIVAANLSKEEKQASFSLCIPGFKSIRGTISVPPLEIINTTGTVEK